MHRPTHPTSVLLAALLGAALTITSACSSTSTSSPASTAPSTSAASSAAPALTTGPSSAAGASSGGASSATAVSGAGSGPATGSAPSGSDPAAALKLAHTGLVGTLPTTAVSPKSGVDIWIVSCGERVTTCSNTAAGAQAAAKSIGWTVHLCDGQLNPAGWSACIRQAVAAKADAIDTIAIDCDAVKQALQEAKAANIKTISGGGFDCSETGGEQVYSGTIQYQPGMTNHQWWAELGKLQADWIIGATKGQAKVLSLQFTDEAWGADIQKAFAAEIATCSGCSIVKTQELGNADVVGGTLRTKFSTALLQSPTVNAINVPIDGWFPAGLAQAVTSSGRASKLSVIGSIGEVANMGYISSGGGENASAAFSSDNSGWAGIDVAVRLMAGQTGDKGFFPEGVSIQVVDKDTNLPPAGSAYVPPTDYKAAYAKLWGKG